MGRFVTTSVTQHSEVMHLIQYLKRLMAQQHQENLITEMIESTTFVIRLKDIGERQFGSRR